MNILIVGAGSVGVYLGTLLNNKKHNIILLGRKKLKKLHDTILIDDVFYPMPKRIYSLPKNSAYDFVFITSKIYDLQNNLKKINKHNIKTKYLISIQNGIVENKIYDKYIKKTNFTSISVFEGFRLLENQLIVNQSKSGWKTDDSIAGKEVSKLLQNAGIKCTTDKKLDSLKAEKTIMNCCVNILSAIKKKTFYELYNNFETKKLMDKIFDESYKILSEEYELKPKEKLRTLFYQIISPMKHYSSTYQDAVSGRKTEIDLLNGLIVKLGLKYKILTPVNQKILNEFIKKYPRQ